jgi:DNA-binding HxlR family transcriptional regulator
MAGGPGLRVAQLRAELGVSRQPLRETLGELVTLGYLQRKEGHGHPLRPEYVLSRRGASVAEAVAELLSDAALLPHAELLGRKWSLPLLAAMSQGAQRFAEFGKLLPKLGPRALALALRDLEAAGLVDREVGDERPPSVRYTAPTLSALSPLLKRLA